MITRDDIMALTNAAGHAGIVINCENIQLLTWTAGEDTHVPLALPVGFSAVYIFKHGDTYLKVGKACGNEANPRYQSQHYYTKAPSTLAKSLLARESYQLAIGDSEPRRWIIDNTDRFNILIPSEYGKHFVAFVESFFILKCNPLFEGRS